MIFKTTTQQQQHAVCLVQEIKEGQTPGFLQPVEAEALLEFMELLGQQEYDKGIIRGYEQGRDFTEEATYH